MGSQWAGLMQSRWTDAGNQKDFMLSLIINFISCVVLYLALVYYLFANRHRGGATLDDPILKLLNPFDFSWAIFFFMYTGILLFLYDAIAQPLALINMMRAFTAVFVLRAIFIALTPLAPPADMILLRDPFIDYVVGFNGEVINDLFFSGHVADLYLFAFCCRRRWIRTFLFALSVIVSILIVWQKVHYMVDVLSAPFFSYACYAFFVREKRKEPALFTESHPIIDQQVIAKNEA